jgi:hypothetical protein
MRRLVPTTRRGWAAAGAEKTASKAQGFGSLPQMNADAKQKLSTKGGWARLESPSGPLAVATDAKGAAITCINFFPTSGAPPADCSGLPEVSADQLPAVRPHPSSAAFSKTRP